jgi:hypothetical protein
MESLTITKEVSYSHLSFILPRLSLKTVKTLKISSREDFTLCNHSVFMVVKPVSTTTDHQVTSLTPNNPKVLLSRPTSNNSGENISSLKMISSKSTVPTSPQKKS